MHFSKALIPVAMAFIPTLISSSPISTTDNPLARREFVLGPNCSGCGLGLSKSGYQELIDQVDTAKVYNVPWDCSHENWHGQLTLPGSEFGVMAAGLMDDIGNPVDTPGTINGDYLKSSLQALNDAVNDVQRQCLSADGKYKFSIGEGASCGGR